MIKKISILFFLSLVFANAKAQQLPWLKISENKRYFVTENKKPFFWLGDTGWLLFIKCNREEALRYLDVRKGQGFNVIQIMLLHSLGVKNVYGSKALLNDDISKPVVTTGSHFSDTAAYDYWDHVEWIVREAAKRGFYLGLVPVWGSNVKEGKVTVEQAKVYARFLAERFKRYSNIIWLNGGDIPGDDHMPVWKAIGETLKKYDPKHLVTYHPRGRYTSSDWFHNESWLDFNMFQSGHRNYAQDTTAREKHHFGEDNWRFVVNDYALKPVKPTIDGEPSYEKIPHGLHDSLQTRWTDADLRRYAYWSVFAGAAGFTYGDNAIMQFHEVKNGAGAFGVRENWQDEFFAPGAQQMHHLKNLILSKSYFDRKPAQEILADNSKNKYEYLVATKGTGYAFVYDYTGRDFSIYKNNLGFDVKSAKWFSPTSGRSIKAFYNKKNNTLQFDPPAETANGNDWVLILEK